MKLHNVLAALLLTATAIAQQPACPNDRPVDDFIAEANKAQSKKANRNKNPIPDVGCIFGWCRETSKTPPTMPNPPRAKVPETPRDSPPTGDTSSKTPAATCNEAMEQSFKAAHNVEVGDLQMTEKHYMAALSRYQEAAEEKPGDAAIYVRVGRAHEKLNDAPKAIEQYEAAAKLPGPEKWTSEARSALQRLKKP